VSVLVERRDSFTPRCARPVACWGDSRGRLPAPPTVLLRSRDEGLAWALCRSRIVAWDLTSGDLLPCPDLGDAVDLAVSGDGRLLLGVDANGLCTLWTTRERARVQTFRAPGHASGSARLSADGRVAVTVANDGTLRVWSTLRGIELRRFHAGPIVSLSPEARFVASVTSRTGRVRIWGVADGRCMGQVLLRDGAPVRALSINDRGALVTGHTDGTVARWDGLARALVRVDRPHVTAVTSVALRDDGERHASHATDGSAWLCDLSLGREWSFDLLGERVGWSPDLRHAVFTRAHMASSIDLENGHRHDASSGHTDAVSALSLSPDGRVALSASRDGTLRLWDTRSGETLWTLEGHDGPVTAAALSPDATLAWSSGERDGARLWDLTRGVEITPVEFPTRSHRALEFSPDGARVLAVRDEARGCAIELFDALQGRLLATGRASARARRPAAFSPDGSVAYLSLKRESARSFLIAHETRTGARVGRVELAGHRANPSDDERGFNLRGDIVAAAMPDRSGWALYNTEDGRPIGLVEDAGHTLGPHPRVMGDRWMLTAPQSDRVFLHDLATGERRGFVTLRHANDAVTALALSPDERWFLAGTARGLVLRYEITRPAEVNALPVAV